MGYVLQWLIADAAGSKVWVWGRSLVGIAGSNPALSNVVFLLVSAVCLQVYVTVPGYSLVQRYPTECSMSERVKSR